MIADGAADRAVVLFDLDGTISDSAASILDSLRHAVEATGQPPLDPAVARSLLGPPFHSSLPPIVGERNTWPVIEAYRAHYATSMLTAAAFPGVPDLLRDLRAAGRRLAVATSKPEAAARRIVDNLALGEVFETVGGDEPDGSFGTKALVIGRVLDRLGRPEPSEVVMVGDREHDVFGAREHGIDCVGVGWGYAMPGELAAARPLLVCATPAELGAALGVRGDAD